MKRNQRSSTIATSLRVLGTLELLLSFVHLAPSANAQSAVMQNGSQFRVSGLLPPPPVQMVPRHRRLRLVRRGATFLFVDDFGRIFLAGRDSAGNLIPVISDPVTNTFVPVFFDPRRDVFFVLLRDSTGRFFRSILDPPFQGTFLDTGFRPSAFTFMPPILVFPTGMTRAMVQQAVPVVTQTFLTVQPQQEVALQSGVMAPRLLVVARTQPQSTGTFRAASPRVMMTGQRAMSAAAMRRLHRSSAVLARPGARRIVRTRRMVRAARRPHIVRRAVRNANMVPRRFSSLPRGMALQRRLRPRPFMPPPITRPPSVVPPGSPMPGTVRPMPPNPRPGIPLHRRVQTGRPRG